MDTVNTVLKAYLQGIWDSIKGISLIYIVIRDTRSTPSNNSHNSQINNAEENDSQSVLSHSASANARSSRRSSSRNNSRREQSKLEEESNILKRVAQCCLLNGVVFGFSIVLFEYGLLPFIRFFLSWMFGHNPGVGASVGNWIVSFLSILFGMTWILPLFILSKIVNSLWFQDIADSAYKFRKGRPQLLPSFSILIADTLFSLLVQTLFLIQSMVVSFLPFNYFGIICKIHLCLLYSLYAFEYKWYNMGWELHKRLTHIEYNWPYFLGFGTLMTVFTQVLSPTYIISGCVFSIFFPFNILSANEANPVVNACDLPMKLFSPVVAISNAVFNRSIRPKVPSTPTTSAAAATAVNKTLMSTIQHQTPNASPMRVRTATPTHLNSHSTTHRSHR